MKIACLQMSCVASRGHRAEGAAGKDLEPQQRGSSAEQAPPMLVRQVRCLQHSCHSCVPASVRVCPALGPSCHRTLPGCSTSEAATARDSHAECAVPVQDSALVALERVSSRLGMFPAVVAALWAGTPVAAAAARWSFASAGARKASTAESVWPGHCDAR